MGIGYGRQRVYAANSDISTLTPRAGDLAAARGRPRGNRYPHGKADLESDAAGAACKGRPGCSAGQLAAVTLVPGLVFSGSMDGHLRAYSTADGKIVWDFDTLPEISQP